MTIEQQVLIGPHALAGDLFVPAEKWLEVVPRATHRSTT